MTYEEFVASKVQSVKSVGIPSPGPISSALSPFQVDCVRFALERGRAALFEDCGLGKTRQQLEWARHVAKYTGGKVLILAPLAVAAQTIREGVAVDIAVSYARHQTEATGAISITNYERLDGFDASSFAGVVLDESSILKSFMGSTKRALVEAFARTPFRLCCTATPAPNDHLELGNHAEFLGVLTSHEMIARWFINDTSLFGNYRLKGHATVPFWDWVASWARCIGKPSDIGHSDEGYILPPLNIHRHVVEVDATTERGADFVPGAGRDQLRLMRLPDMNATNVHAEKRRTVVERAREVARIAAAEPVEQWLIWCETDYEADALRAVIPEAVEVRGPDSPERKEAALMGFADGSIRVLITKSRIAGFGMNFQNCARQAMVSATFSYEQFYQEVRRSWRFGQKRPVEAHVVMAHTELGIWDVLTRKQEDHESMKLEMYAAMRRAQSKRDDRRRDYNPTKPVKLPAWMVAR